MHRIQIAAFVATSLACGLSAQEGPYKVVQTAKVGGAGGFDYVYADSDGRRLYIPRTGPAPRVTVFNLDTLAPAGEIAGVSARGVAVDPASHHGFASSKPVAMFDTTTLAMIKTIEVQGNPDGIMFDPFNRRVWVFSHSAPNATVIDAADGTVVGTVDLEGAPEQAVSDGKGTIYVDIEDKANVAVVDAKALKVTKHYGFEAKAEVPAGLAFDLKSRVLFAACRNPAAIVALNADDGKVIATLPIGAGVDGAVFNPATGEVFSSQSDGTLTVIKAGGRSGFAVEQTVQTKPSGKTLTLDTKTNRILVIAAEFGPAPAPAAGGRPVRGPMVPDSFSILAISK